MRSLFVKWMVAGILSRCFGLFIILIAFFCAPAFGKSRSAMVGKVCGLVVIFLVLGLNTIAIATPPSCTSFLVKWEPLIELVSRYGSPDAVERFRTLESSFVCKTYCPAKVPAEWQDIRSGMLGERLRELVNSWLRQGSLNKVSTLFEEINHAKSIRSFEDSYGTNSGWIGCAEVSLELKIRKGMYVISMNHMYRRWDKCPAKFQKKVSIGFHLFTILEFRPVNL